MDPIFSAFNYAQGRIFGLEASASYKGKDLSSYLNLGFTHARGRGIETGQFDFGPDELDYVQSHWVHLDHEQRLSASAGVVCHLDNDLTLSADALFGSGLRNYVNTHHLPGYASVNVAAAKTFDLGGSLGKLDTRLALLNLFDRVYQIRDGSGIGVSAPQFGARRGAYLTVSRPF